MLGVLPPTQLPHHLLPNLPWAQITFVSPRKVKHVYRLSHLEHHTCISLLRRPSLRRTSTPRSLLGRPCSCLNTARTHNSLLGIEGRHDLMLFVQTHCSCLPSVLLHGHLWPMTAFSGLAYAHSNSPFSHSPTAVALHRIFIHCFSPLYSTLFLGIRFIHVTRALCTPVATPAHFILVSTCTHPFLDNVSDRLSLFTSPTYSLASLLNLYGGRRSNHAGQEDVPTRLVYEFRYGCARSHQTMKTSLVRAFHGQSPRTMDFNVSHSSGLVLLDS